MIAKGNQRGGGSQLATHLANVHDNERVEVGDVRGSIANDVHGAFAEWRAQARATQCEKYLYSLSVNPDQSQGRMMREQYFDFLDRVEQRLGLTGQGRVVVFHEKVDKDGIAREHCHAVWSRIDVIAGSAVQISHDRMKLRTVVRQFAKEHGRELPPGLEQDHGAKRHERRADQANLTEKQQEERSGISKQERRADLTQVWHHARDGASFAAALKERGYILARGDKRAYVVVDRAGEVHSLARQIEGVKTGDIKDRLASSHPTDALPSAGAAQEEATQRRERLQAMQKAPQAGPTPADRKARLRTFHEARRRKLEDARQELQARQAKERQALSQSAVQQPARRLPAFVRFIVGRYQQHQQEKHLTQRHRAEQRELGRKERNLKACETRERRSMETKIKRDAFQNLAHEIRQRDNKYWHGVHHPITRERQAEKALPAIPADARRSLLARAFEPRHPSPQPPKSDQTLTPAEHSRPQRLRDYFRTDQHPAPPATEQDLEELQRLKPKIPQFDH